MSSVSMEKIVSLAKRRGFVFPGSEIYGGLANSWDFGPLGVELKNNIKQEWWKMFVHNREDVVGIDSAIIMNPKVWEASGHIKEFVDSLVECKECKGRFREDDKRFFISTQNDSRHKCPNCGGKLSKSRQFNLLFKTFIGPVEDQSSVAYLRPETAQGMFVNYENILNTTRKQLPFGVAQIGKAFRNEITPGNFVFRTREFEQMEIEYFIEGKEWKKQFEHWLREMKKWMKRLGLANKNIEYKEIPTRERAHYSKRTVDIFYKFPFGSDELYGLAYRGDFDLKNHGFKNPAHVIEPTFGVERTALAAMVEHYHEEKVTSGHPERSEGSLKNSSSTAKVGTQNDNVRVVLKFPRWLAPYKIAVLPLSKKPQLSRLAKKIHKELLGSFACEYDETQSIGKRYRRQDEIGTPFCVTVDFDSLKDNKVTVRDRDSMKQERIKIPELKQRLNEKF
ncbi:MAG: glycine--tRNA ligase [Patescibacteria group bacterium]